MGIVIPIGSLELIELGPVMELTQLASGRIQTRTQVSFHISSSRVHVPKTLLHLF